MAGMMTQDRDYEDVLRRALAAAAESIEPTGDGLQRIRHRLDSRRSPRSVLFGCAKWLEQRGTRFLVRLEPAMEAGRGALRRAGPLLALASFLAGLFSPREQVFALIEFTTNVHGMTAERVDVWNDFLDAHGIEVRDDPA